MVWGLGRCMAWGFVADSELEAVHGLGFGADGLGVGVVHISGLLWIGS